jgi:hypothetical protein
MLFSWYNSYSGIHSHCIQRCEQELHTELAGTLRQLVEYARLEDLAWGISPRFDTTNVQVLACHIAVILHRTIPNSSRIASPC